MAITAAKIATNNTLEQFRQEFNNLQADVDGLESGTITFSTISATTQNITNMNILEDGSIIFEGATDDAHETSLTVTDPTADRTITFPNESGNVHTSGGDTTHTNIIIGDAGTIGSASDVDAISIGSDGDITLTQDLELQHDGATVSFGAENDTILTHTDGSGLTLNSTNKIMFNDASQFIHAPSATVLDLAATDEIELTATLIDVVGNFTNSGTLVSTGVVTANAGVVVDEMTLDADTITATDDFIIDAAADITLDAAGDDILLKSGGTHEGNINFTNSNLTFKSIVSDKDMIFQGNDGGAAITALTLDMSEAGAATFNGNVTVGGDLDVTGSLDLSDANLTNVGSISLDSISGDGDTDTSITFSGSNVITVANGGTGQVTFNDGSISPVSDSDVDLGTTSLRFKDIYIDSATVTGEVTATGFTGTLDGILGSGAAAAATVTTLDTSGAVNLNLATDSTSSTSGALIVDGGVGVAKKLYVGTDLDVDGTANLDIVDIDGAVDMATTALVTGVLTTTATQVATGGITSGSNIVSDTDSTDDLGTTSVRWANLYVDAITATDQITATGFTGTLDGILGSGSASAATVTSLDTSATVNLNLATDSTSSTSGALIVDGGVGVAKKLFVGTDLDVDGTANLDIVDIDGAVDMATTLQVDGVATFTGRDIHSGGITIANDGQIGSVGDVDSIAISSTGVVTFSQSPVFPDGSIAIADLDIDGGTDIGADLTTSDLIVVDDGAGGANRKAALSRMITLVVANIDDPTALAIALG